MIIDLVVVNTIFWSFIVGYNYSPKKTFSRVMVIIVALAITLNISGSFTIFNRNRVIETIAKNDYVISVSEEYSHRDYTLTRAFVNELPVTTEMQNIIIEEYYKNNTSYIVDTLIETAGETISKTMEMLLLLTIIIIVLNLAGSITKVSDYKKKSVSLSITSGIIAIISNLIVVSIIIILINLISIFMVKDIPKVSIEGSIFTPLIHKIIDIVINII